MPEGDTIYRAARTLHRALAGSAVTRFETQLAKLAAADDQSPLVGRIIQSVEARGKHMLITFSGALILRTHMRMHGSWHLYRHGERWRASRGDARLVVETAAWVAVGFKVPEAELMTAEAATRHQALSALGPDLLGEAPDLDAAQGRLTSVPGMPIAEALLKQQFVAGLGNVYKSELMYICRLHPSQPAGTIRSAQIARLLQTAQKLMRFNVRESSSGLSGGRNTTGRLNPRERVWVYRRTGKPCLTCGDAIRTRREADTRSTYWCPTCQVLEPLRP
jgi:endonuclease VIII